jgi:hypothetical protein
MITIPALQLPEIFDRLCFFFGVSVGNVLLTAYHCMDIVSKNGQ